MGLVLHNKQQFRTGDHTHRTESSIFILEVPDFEVSAENLLAHKRSVKPGNHLKKLKPETVDRLNGALAEVLELFAYR